MDEKSTEKVEIKSRIIGK